jgi:single-strand DNA-binding protein
MNKIFVIGNLTRDPELTTAASSGVKTCRFVIAVKRSFVSKDKDNEQKSDFFNVICWRGLAENCAKYLAKGKPVSVVGSIQIQQYTGTDGTKKQHIEIIADEVEFLYSKGEGGSNNFASESSNESSRVDSLKIIPDDDLPF